MDDSYFTGLMHGRTQGSGQNYGEKLNKSLLESTTSLLATLKEVENSRDEWKVYAKQLECQIEGIVAMRNALTAEIEKCTAPHLLRETTEQLKLYDDAYITEAKKNGLPESQWNDKVIARRDKK